MGRSGEHAEVGEIMLGRGPLGRPACTFQREAEEVVVKVNSQRPSAVLPDLPVHEGHKILSHRVEEGQELPGAGRADHFLVEDEPVGAPLFPVPAK